MAGMIILFLLGAMAGSWLFRVLLLRVLRLEHPEEFVALGQPSNRQMTSLLPKHQDLHVALWRFLWGGRAFRIGDPRVADLAWAALASDVVLLGSTLLLFWVAAHQ